MTIAAATMSQLHGDMSQPLGDVYAFGELGE